jgi:hypothetical protein
VSKVQEIEAALRRLPTHEQREIALRVLDKLAEETGGALGKIEFEAPIAGDMDSRLRSAAEALLEDYSNDKNLTAFTALDGDPIHA